MYFDSSIIVARWPHRGDASRNWGDKLNRELIHKLSDRPVAHVSDVQGWDDRAVFRVIGSGLANSNASDVVWGMGFIAHGQEMQTPPARICAVRGPMSRNRLLELGIGCPEIFGDPALFYPLFYHPTVDVEFDFGVIQHFREFGVVPPVQLPEAARVRQIDICGSLRDVVNAVLSCRTIVSSSLHGVICAHAYGVPAYWLKASDLQLGDDFKFHDYFASIGHPSVVPATANEHGVLQIGGSPAAPGASSIHPEQLLDACPFLSSTRRRDLLRTIQRWRDAGKTGIVFSQA